MRKKHTIIITAFLAAMLLGCDDWGTDPDDSSPTEGHVSRGGGIRLGWPEPDGPWRTVVGIAPDLDMDGAMDPEGDPAGVYVPLAQTDVRFVSVAVRTRGNPLAFAPTVREEVMSLQGDTPVYFVRTLHDAINTNLLDIILLGSLLWALALAAFLLASVGLYGVTSFLAGQRTRELGVRMALGAKAGDVFRLILRQGTGQILIGLTLGVLLAAGLMAVMASGGMEMIPWSTPVTGIVCLVLVFTGLSAVFVPAWRARPTRIAKPTRRRWTGRSPGLPLDRRAAWAATWPTTALERSTTRSVGLTRTPCSQR